MAKLHRVLVVLSLFLAPVLFAQSADISLSVADSPDPVSRDGNITYTVQVANNGPNAATNATMSVYNSTGLGFVSVTEPAGWSCTEPTVGAFVQFSCTNPSLAAGVTSTFTVVATTDTVYYGNNEGTINTVFTAGSSTADPVPGNSMVQASTAYIVPDADMGVTVTDSPDPVHRDGTITYTATVTNAGPDPAINATFGVNNNSGLGFVSVNEPAGWTCAEPAAGAFVQFSCTNPNFAVGASTTFTVVATTDTVYYGNAEGTITTSFSVGSGQADPVDGNNVVHATTAYIVPDADMGVTVTDSPDPVFPDGQITYTATVTNAGPDPAINAQFGVHNSSGLGFVSVNEPAGWSCAEPAPGAFVQFTCTHPSFAVGASATFTVVATTDTVYYGNAEGTITTSFSVGSGQADPVDGNNVVNATTAYVTPDADISVVVSDSPDPVAPDGNITYTVTVANAGPDTAPNVTLSSFGGNNLRFVSASVPAGWNCTLPPAGTQTTSLTCTLASMVSGDSDVLTFVMQADSDLLGINDRNILFGFQANSSVADPNDDNNDETETTLYSAPDANLSITATDSPDPVNAGSNITYTGTVTNAGPDAGTNTTLTIPLSSSLLFQSFTPPTGFSCTTPAVGANGTITCTIASLANGASLPFTLVARVNPSLASGPDGVIEQTFLVGSSIADPTPANNELDVFTQYLTPDADLAVTNSDSPDPVASGGTITYTQTISNTGPAAATNVTFTQTIPASVGFQSISAPAGFTCTTPAVGANGTITCTAASLANGAGGTFTLRVTVLASSGTVGNTVVADSDTFDPDATDNSASVSTTITATPTADVSVTKTTTTTTASPGSTIPFTISIANNGPDAAGGVVMTDALPAQLRFQSITTPTGFNCTTPAVGTNGTITCNAATLANGANASFSLVTTVAPGATSGNISNTATVTTTTNDPTAGNGSGSTGTIALAPASADLSIVKNTTATTATAGSTFNYTIVITNAGPNAASSVVMTDVLPASLLFQSITTPAGFTCTTPAVGANGTITCNATTLANGATATFTLTVRVGASSGSVTNSASVSSSTADPDGGDTSDPAPPVTLAPASADLSVVKSTTSTFAATGSTLTFTIEVANAGASTASNVVVTDVLPTGLQFVSATPSQGTCTGTTTVTCNLGAIARNANATITLRALVTATSGTISNTATANSTETDPDPGDNASTTPAIPVGEPAAVAAVPTLSEWALIALASILGLLAMMKMRL